MDLNLGGVKNALDTVQGVSDALRAVGQIAATILDLLRVFTVPSLPNPIAAVANALVAQLEALLDSLADTGVFGLYVVPTSLDDLADSAGGFPRFSQKVIASFYDTDDINRPQVDATGVLGGIVIYVNAPSAAGIIQQAIALYNLFGQRPEINYPAPINVRATPADDNGSATPGLLEAFLETRDPLTTILLEWQEPTSTQSLFFDLFAQNKFYIERSRTRDGILVTQTRPSVNEEDFLAKRKRELAELRGECPVEFREPELSPRGEPRYVWEPLDPANPFLEAVDADEGEGRGITGNFLAGTYSTVLRDVDPGQDNGYYYRITSVPEDTVLVQETAETTLADGTAQTITIYTLQLDGQEYTGSSPSVPVYGFIPDIDFSSQTAFNLPDALLNVYRAAYLLRMDTTVFNASSQPRSGSGLLSPVIPDVIQALDVPDFEFDGEGQITDAFESQNPAGFVDSDDGTFRLFQGSSFPDEVFPDGPPGFGASRRTVETLGSVASSDAIEQDPFAGARELFAAKLGLTPRQRFRLFTDQVATDKIERIVPLMTRNETLFEAFRIGYLNAQADIEALLTGFTTDFTVTEEVGVREAVAALLVLVDGQIRPGLPPNWRSVRLFRDVLPEVDLVGERLLNVISAINNAIQGVNTRLDATVEGLQRRLAALDAVVDALDEIIAFLEAAATVSLNASILFVPPTVGGVAAFVDEFQTATNPPASLPTDYGAGFVLAAGGDAGEATALFNALRLVFGF